MNNVTVTGALSDDPELRYSGSGTALCSFTIYESYKPKDGGDRVYHNYDVTVFGETAEYFAESAAKGDTVIVVGRLNQDRWEQEINGETQKRSKVKIIASDLGMSTRWGPVTPTRSERRD